MLSKFGNFSPAGSEFKITTPDIPRNWYNYFHTDHYVSFTSQAGAGYGLLQDEMGRRYTPVAARGVYVHDGKEGWNLSGLPLYEAREEYLCTHGVGYTVTSLKKNGIATEYGIFVPNEETPTTGYDLLFVKVTNCTDQTKEIKVMAYADNTVDGMYQPQGYNTEAIYKDELVNGLHRAIKRNWNDQDTGFEVFVIAGQALSGYDCAKNAFIGPYGSIADPIAIHKNGCTNSACVAEKCGFAVQSTVTLAPGESGFVSFAMGMTESIDRVNEIAEKISCEEKVMALLSAVKEKFAAQAEALVIETPDKELNHLFNHWLKYQTEMGSRWARVRHNGYRDIASDTECLSAFDPALAWERIKRLLSFQYANGYAPRTFIDGKIKDNNFSDCTVWLTFTVYAIIHELGDPNLLYEEVPFNNGETASVYEHLRRSVDFLYNFKGHHGLVQIWGGDWNDCMNFAGIDHKGVSIWLTMAWYRANAQFSELSKLLGREDMVTLAAERAAEIRDLVDEYGWDADGGYYIYAITDEGHKIGHSSCEEGSVFLNPQLWSVLSGISKDGKDVISMDNAEKLLTGDLGTRVSGPAYTHYLPYIGSMTQKAPGVQENGGVYLHPMCWKLAVDAIMGRADKVQYDIEHILPFRNPVVDGRAEPYVLCNCYMGKETGYRYGTPGQSWRTATGQWFLYALSKFVLGLNPKIEGLTLTPCLPSDWNEVKVTRKFRGCTYNILYTRTGKEALTVDGEALAPHSVLPYRKGETVNVIVEI